MIVSRHLWPAYCASFGPSFFVEKSQIYSSCPSLAETTNLNKTAISPTKFMSSTLTQPPRLMRPNRPSANPGPLPHLPPSTTALPMCTSAFCETCRKFLVAPPMGRSLPANCLAALAKSFGSRTPCANNNNAETVNETEVNCCTSHLGLLFALMFDEHS